MCDGCVSVLVMFVSVLVRLCVSVLVMCVSLVVMFVSVLVMLCLCVGDVCVLCW